MTRSITYWYDYMIAEKQTMANLSVYQPSIDSSQTLLTDLKSTSKVARWRLMIWVVATGYFALDAILQLAKIDLLAILERSKFGTLPWYISTAKKFQYGDAVLLDGLFWKYAVEDPTKQIVALAAAQAIEGKINLKIAKLVSGVPTPLSGPELTAFTSYIKAVKPPTVNVIIINSAADELQLTIEVTVDANILSLTGELISSPGTFPVEEAVALYLQSFASDAGFNSFYEIMRQQDFIQSAAGVVTAYVTMAKARDGSNPFTTFTQRYNPKAGHIGIDPLTPLNTTITYTANV